MLKVADVANESFILMTIVFFFVIDDAGGDDVIYEATRHLVGLTGA